MLDIIAKMRDTLRMRYPGGKGRCFQHLISLMPPHRTFIETHLGGGAVLRQKRPAEINIGIEKDEAVVARWSAVAPPYATIVHGDGERFLADFDFAGDELVYCDPPYPRATRAKARLYRHDYDDADHRRLLAVLRVLPCMVMVSSYDNDMYAETLSDWRVVRFQGDSHTGPKTETVWLNFPEPDALHDYRYCGQDFRERERLRRRRSGLAQRVGKLSPLERNALFQDLAKSFGPEIRAAVGGP